jgi:type I restriction enzyme S subunit
MASKSGSVDPSKFPDEVFDLYSIPAFDRGHPEVVAGKAIGSAKQVVRPGDVLLSRIVPHIRRSGVVANGSGRRIIASGEWIVFRSDRVHPDYLRHVLVGDPFHAQFMNTVAGVGGSLLRARPEHVGKIKIPLPPLAEQRRIAEVLDRAEALRAKRRETLVQLDTLTQSIFLDLFGDPATNPKNWELLRLQDVLSMPLRNGLSPSNVGKVTAKVLTLSAITGSEFDYSAWKVSTFRSAPPTDQSVDENDFLICRGNGNVRLVGKGYFPTRRMPDVTFPDTMIAARVRTERLERVFLQHIWGWNAVRRQVESLARTTNGTFKVNQTMLEGITFIGPPLKLQREFARCVGATDKMKATQRTSLAELDALFAVLQHRAFRGEL